MKINRKEGAHYFVNQAGEIIESITTSNVIGKIERKPNHNYRIDYEGNVIENEIVKVSLDEFYEMKKNGRLAQLYREGKDVEIVDPKATLKDFDNHRFEELVNSLKDRTIVGVHVSRESDGTLELKMELDDGRTLILREGAGVSYIELE